MTDKVHPDLLSNSPDPETRAAILENWLEQYDSQALVLRANCLCDLPEPFVGIRVLLQHLVDNPVLMTRDVADKIGPELVAIWPALAQQSAFSACPRLGDIALAGTKRRLHKDSEQLFRIVHALSSLVLMVHDMGRAPLVLALDRLDAADRLTINTLYHIQNRRGSRAIQIVASADEGWLNGHGPSPWTMPGRGISEKASALYEYAIAEQKSVYENVVERMTPAAEDGKLLRLAHEKPSREICGNLFDPQAADGRIEARLQAIASECLNFSMHFQISFIALAAAHHFAEQDGRCVGIGVRLLEALTLCYVGHYDKALAEIEAIVETEDLSAAEYAQAHFYMGLISQKCLNDGTRAARFLERGMARITPEKSRDWRHALEYGWCSNASALVAWRSGNADQARTLVLDALTTSLPFNDPQNANLRVNLVNNLSVLAETSGDYNAAVSIWDTLRNASDAVSGGRLAKSFHFRRGHLKLRKGLVAEALDDFVIAAEMAMNVGDHFHTDIISDACGYCNVMLGAYDAARKWNEIGLQNARTLDDTEGAWHYELLLAAIYYFETRSPAALLDTAARLAQQNTRMERLADALEHLVADGADPAEIRDLLFLPPKPKLTTPFALAHMSTPSTNRVDHTALRHNRLGTLVDQIPDRAK